MDFDFDTALRRSLTPLTIAAASDTLTSSKISTTELFVEKEEIVSHAQAILPDEQQDQEG